MCAIDEYASIRFTFVWVSATRFPRVIVNTASTITTCSQSVLSGPSASTNRRRISAKAPIFGPTDR